MDKPILFSTSMVQAILSGQKTMTRRVINPQPNETSPVSEIIKEPTPPYKDCWLLKTPFYGKPSDGVHFGGYYVKPCFQPGDILWVRETWRQRAGGYSYKADASDWACQWKPSIYMPKAAARIFLRVTDVRVEQLQDMPVADIHREGAFNDFCQGCLDANDRCKPQKNVDVFCGMEKILLDDFANLWDTLNAKRGYGWDVNPWVWVIEFERCEKLDGGRAHEEAYAAAQRRPMIKPLTLKQIKSPEYKNYPLWLEYTDIIIPVSPIILQGIANCKAWCIDDKGRGNARALSAYNNGYRFWASDKKPTDTERKAARWDD